MAIQRSWRSSLSFDTQPPDFGGASITFSNNRFNEEPAFMSPSSRGGTTRSGQLDEISEAIGELKGRFDGLERYIHDKRHDDNNISQKIDGIGSQIAREVGRLKGELQGEIASFRSEIEKLAVRVTTLESARQRDDGAKSVWIEILKSPIVAGTIGGLLAAIGMAWALLRSGKL